MFIVFPRKMMNKIEYFCNVQSTNQVFKYFSK